MYYKLMERHWCQWNDINMKIRICLCILHSNKLYIKSCVLFDVSICIYVFSVSISEWKPKFLEWKPNFDFEVKITLTKYGKTIQAYQFIQLNVKGYKNSYCYWNYWKISSTNGHLNWFSDILESKTTKALEKLFHFNWVWIFFIKKFSKELINPEMIPRTRYETSSQ